MSKTESRWVKAKRKMNSGLGTAKTARNIVRDAAIGTWDNIVGRFSKKNEYSGLNIKNEYTKLIVKEAFIKPGIPLDKPFPSVFSFSHEGQEFCSPSNNIKTPKEFAVWMESQSQLQDKLLDDTFFRAFSKSIAEWTKGR